MLATGARLGPYEVLGPLGAGGMGEVWRARDTRLGREVALKTLPKAFAGDPARLSRFEREARLLASLNHAGIATVHGFEQVDGVSLLVQELVEGPTLAERLRRGALPLREALPLAVRIAEALDAAHQRGIVHRDLKPSNIKLLPGGRVKVLDFGLAKALESAPAADGVSRVPTDTSPTEMGAVLGTAPYMSPEQAHGEQTDERTDVWAFGCVLYEMLAGTRAFAGATASAAVAAVLEREPDWAALPPATPAAVRAVLRHCLQKDRSRRLRSAADAAIAIEDALASPAADALHAAGPRTQAWLGMALAALLALAAGIAVSHLWTARAPAAYRGGLRFDVDIPPELALPQSVLSGNTVALSPDGSSIVFQAEGKGLYLRPLDGTAPVPIRGAERGVHPFFSPNGAWIGFQADGKLQKIPLGGGAPRVLADAPSLRGASWAGDGTIVYSPVFSGGLFRVSAEGGTAEALTEPDPAVEISHRWPQLLPGGAVLYTSYASSGQAAQSRIAVLPRRGTRKVLVEGGTYGRYVPTGHLLYANGGTVFAAPFDVRRLELTGPAGPVLQDVRMALSSGMGVAFLDFSPTGSLVYVVPHPRPRSVALLRVGRDGAATPLSDPRLGLASVSLSPDGLRLIAAVTEPDGSGNLWRYEVANGSWTQLTFGHINGVPTWSPRGDRIAFASNRSGEFRIFVMSADGGEAEPLAGLPPGWCFPEAWTRDGRGLLFANSNPQTGQDLWELPLQETARARSVLITPRHEASADLSPNGRWIVYQESDPAGRTEIYVRPYRGADRRWAVANVLGDGSSWICCPRWSRSGAEIFYLAGGALPRAGAPSLEGTAVMAVPVGPEASALRIGSPRVVLERARRIRSYDLMPDGRQFVIAEDADDPQRLRVIIAPNWFDELKAKVPGGGRR